MDVWIPQGSISEGWAFCTTDRRVGSISVVGPSSGKRWAVSIRGEWLPEDDALELYETMRQVWCRRENRWIEVNQIILTPASPEALKRKPTGDL
jgi:hypothetical protein